MPNIQWVEKMNPRTASACIAKSGLRVESRRRNKDNHGEIVVLECRITLTLYDKGTCLVQGPSGEEMDTLQRAFNHPRIPAFSLLDVPRAKIPERRTSRPDAW